MVDRSGQKKPGPVLPFGQRVAGALNPVNWYRKDPALWRESGTAYLYLLPALIILGIFVFYPFFSAFYISLFKWGILPPRPYVGFANYSYIFNDKYFWRALWHTFYYVIITVPVTLFLAILVATLLNKGLRFLSFARTSFFLSYISPIVAIAMVWRWMYNADYGLINYLLSLLNKLPFVHIDPIAWLNDPRYSIPALIILSVWHYVGYHAIILLAGMQNIEQQYYDAAKVDGASGFQTWLHVTVPLLTPQLFFVLIMSLIGSFKVFTEVITLFNGPGPLRSAETIVYYILRMSGRIDSATMHLGRAAAGSVVLFGIIFVLTIFQMTVTQRRVHYQ
ncbi:MAG TPA: sugar ABC transporter permease [Candidatus Bipolaricaulis sp.]|nr:sugar ABC transporter permease [Candidatus Bipolaricaulis sp.]HRU21128.1 sugar ABC transporter permease [Candidatus Bipolaricaulis sp.]